MTTANDKRREIKEGLKARDSEQPSPIVDSKDKAREGEPLYQIVVFQPGSTDDIATELESRTPFAAISKGDLINPRQWSTKDAGVYRVVNVEHHISKATGQVRHVIHLFTQLVEDSRATRRQ